MVDEPATPSRAEEFRTLAESIVDTIRQPLLILTGDLRVQSANRAFYNAFAVEPAETEGHQIYELGNQQWDIPRLRELLSEVLPHEGTVEEFEVEHTFESIGEKIMLVSARRVAASGDRASLILVAIEDVTERVYRTGVYAGHEGNRLNNEGDFIFRGARGPLLEMTQVEDGYVGTLTLGVER